MDVCLLWVLLGTGLCDVQVESYRLWCVVVCDQETSCDEEAIAALGCRARESNNKVVVVVMVVVVVFVVVVVVVVVVVTATTKMNAAQISRAHSLSR
jgi:disulfide bond formation protein DsbB